MPLPSAPLQSLISFRESPFQLSIGSTMFLIWISKILGYLLFTEEITLLIVLTRKIWLSVTICGGIIGIPYALWNHNTKPYYFQPLGLMIGNGYFKGNADYVDTDGMMLISEPFDGIKTIHFIIVLSVLIYVIGILYMIMLHFYTRNVSQRGLRKRASYIALASIITNFIVIYPINVSLNEKLIKYNSTYSNGMGFSDENYIYTNHPNIQAMKHDGSDSFPLLRDVTKQSSTFESIIDWYVDEDYIYYIQRDLDYGDIYYWRIDKQNFHEDCIYKERRGQRNQQKSTKYLGLITDINIENVEYDTYIREDILSFWVDCNFIFVVDSNGINLIDYVNKKNKQIIKSQISTDCIAYQRGIIYYADLQNRVYSYNISENSTEQIDIPYCHQIYICNNILFFTTFSNEIGYYDSSCHILEDIKINNTSHLSCNGAQVYFCNEKNEPVIIDLIDFTYEVLAYDKPAYNITAFENSPYVEVYAKDNKNQEYIYEVCLLDETKKSH